MGRKRYKQVGQGSFFGDFVYQQVIPPDHFLVKLKELIPWDRYTEQLTRYYEGGAEVGRPPYDPALVLRMLLLAYLYDVSERQVEEMVTYHLPMKYFVGLAVTEKAPDHTTLRAFRRRLLENGHLAANQVGYNMFDRRMEAAVLPYCQEQEIGFMAYGTLAYGLLTGAFTRETTFVDWDWRSHGKAFGLPLFERENFEKELQVVEQLKALAGRYDKTVAQLAIAWVLDNPAVTVALVGIRNVKELEEDIAAVDWKLTEADKTEIDRIFQEEGVSTYRNHRQAL